MQSNSIQEMSEVGDAYWRHKVVALETLVAELLVKNQNMRFDLQAIEKPKPMVEGIDAIQNQSGSRLQS